VRRANLELVVSYGFEIDKKTYELYRVYEEKKRGQEATPSKEQTPRTVTNYMIQQPLTGLPH